MVPLPNHHSLNIKALSKIFDSTQNSYKHLLFGFLLGELARRPPNRLDFNANEITKGMLQVAEFPVIKCRLSLGNRDQVSTLLIGEGKVGFGDADLLDWVPFRLIRPFFADALRNKADPLINRIIQQSADQSFNATSPALYRIHMHDRIVSGIEIHPSWQAYLIDHYNIIDAWRRWHWAEYLQRRNPAALNVIRKLEQPSRQTQSVEKIRSVWRAIAENGHEPLVCTFTEEVLRPEKIVVDHFLPWSYVGHNQKWNLCPTTQPTNSLKSNKLPRESYFSNLLNVQMHTLKWVRATKSDKEWTVFVEDYEIALQLREDELLDRSKVCDALLRVIHPHYQLAKNMGFATEWVY